MEAYQPIYDAVRSRIGNGDIGAAVEAAMRDAQLICKDAARYRWLKERRPVLLATGFFGNGCINKTNSDVDAAIDEGMLKTANAEIRGGEADPLD